METHLLIQLLIPFSNLGNLLRLREVCKSWRDKITQQYPKLHEEFFLRKFNPKIDPVRNFAKCIKERKTGYYQLYLNHPRKIHIRETKVIIPIPIPKLIDLIAVKYEPEMWIRYWENHMDHHLESGKSKCLGYEIPNVELIIFEIIGRTIKMRAILEVEGKKGRSCYESCSNLKINF